MGRSKTLPCGVVIDADDLTRVLALGSGWYIPKGGGWKGYAIIDLCPSGKRTVIALHRFLMGAVRGELIDHRDGNTLNCRKENLRRANKKINAYNMHASKNMKRGRYKGVFRVSGTIDGKLKAFYLGCFERPEDAARAYDKKAKELFGKYAAPNFP